MEEPIQSHAPAPAPAPQPPPAPAPQPAPAPAPQPAPAPAPTQEGEQRGMIPYARLAESQADLQATKRMLAELTTEVEQLRPLRAERDAWQEERAFFSAGITDPEAMDVGRHLYSRIPADQRPKDGIGAWLADIRANPDKTPKALTPYLAPPPSPAPAPGGGVRRTPATTPAPSGSPITSDAVIAASQRAQKLNTPEAWKEFHTFRDAYNAQRAAK